MGALNNKGGRGQRNCEEIGAGATFLAASPLVRERFARVFAASPLSRAPDKTAMLRRLRDSLIKGRDSNRDYQNPYHNKTH